MELINLNDLRVAAAFNEWLRRYIEEPARCQREWETIEQFRQEIGSNAPVMTYGATCAAYLAEIVAEL